MLILGFGATIPASAALTEITLVIALASLAAGAPIGVLLGRDLVEEVGFTGWIPAGLAMAASAVVVLVVGLLVGLMIPLEVPLYRALVPVMAAAGAAAGALKVTWAEN
jgi:hypothetical protein